jgi:6-phosphogluconolactonase
VAPGAGPRQVEFSKDGKFLYVLNEMGCTLTAFEYDGETGKAKDIGTVSMLPGDYAQSDKDTGAELWLHPSGRFLYASNRGHDSIVTFKVDQGSGKLSEPKWTPSGGKVPRYFGIDPSGKWMLVANQGSGNVVSFGVSEADGSLKATGDVVEVPAPTCLKWLGAPAE